MRERVPAGVSPAWRTAARWCAALCVAVGLAGCAVPDASRSDVGRYKLALPSGTWTELPAQGAFSLPAAVAGASVPAPLTTRAWALRGDDGAWLAVALLHVGDVSRNTTSWTGACPASRDVWVQDAAQSGATRIDCLRFRRAAEFGDWLGKNRPDLAQWTAQRGVQFKGTYAHLNHVLTTTWGDYVALDVLAVQRLVRPATHSNDEFLRAPLPTQAWIDRVGESVRLSTRMFDGHLALPPFPFPINQP